MRNAWKRVTVGKPPAPRVLLLSWVTAIHRKGPRLLGRIWSVVRVSTSFQKKNSPPRGSVRVRTPRRGSDRVRSTGNAGFYINSVYFVLLRPDFHFISPNM